MANPPLTSFADPGRAARCGRRRRAFGTAAAALLLYAAALARPQPAFAEAPVAVERNVAPSGQRWELGLGIVGARAHLREATAEDPFRIENDPAAGVVFAGGWRVTPSVSLLFEIGSARHETSVAGLRGQLNTLSLNCRYLLPVAAGPATPYLRGGYGLAGMRIGQESGGGETLVLEGMLGIFGAGLRFRQGSRLSLDLELNHGVINYRDASVTLESLLVGTRIDKAGRSTRIAGLISYGF